MADDQAGQCRYKGRQYDQHQHNRCPGRKSLETDCCRNNRGQTAIDKADNYFPDNILSGCHRQYFIDQRNTIFFSEMMFIALKAQPINMETIRVIAIKIYRIPSGTSGCSKVCTGIPATVSAVHRGAGSVAAACCHSGNSSPDKMVLIPFPSISTPIRLAEGSVIAESHSSLV